MQGLTIKLTQSGPVELDVSFACAPGEVVALVGPSGSGKTTTLKAIAGLVRPQNGRVALGDDVWFDSGTGIFVRPEARRVGFVFQDYALFPHLTVLGNVTLAMGHIDAALRHEKGCEVLERVGIASLADRRPGQLSGGERQRVAIARALARGPQVLLLDEPFSAIDRPARQRLKAEVRALTAAVGVPVVLVTHDIDEAAALASRIVVIDAGATIATGTPDDMMTNSVSPRVAEILGIEPVK